LSILGKMGEPHEDSVGEMFTDAKLHEECFRCSEHAHARGLTGEK
jgi:hypothetical protein